MTPIPTKEKPTYINITKSLLILVVLTALSCSTDTSNNGIPSEFEVTVNSTSVTNIDISWSESFDPEGDTISYSVYLENQEYSSHQNTRTYSFENLSISNDYEGFVIAHDPSGNERIADFSFTTTENLPPSNFEIILATPSNISIDVSWTEAIDPEGTNVSYDLYIDDTLIASNLSETSFLIENLNAATVYNLKIVAKDDIDNTTNLISNLETLDGIYQGDLSLRTQQAVNSFGELGYIEITGNLEMDGLAVFTDVTDLSPINSIKIVRGYFHINFMGTLTSLSGLGIEHVGQNFKISNNDGLNNLDGLDKLEEVFGTFQIEQNSNLQDISGINNLTTIGTTLAILNNINLITVTGFNNLNSVDSIWFQANWSLTQINAFSSVTALIGDLNLTSNTALTTLEGINNIESIGRVFIKNTLLENFNALSSLSIVGGDFDIQDNSALQNVNGLATLTEITYGNLSFFYNTSLTSLNGLENLNQIGGTINFVGNSNLSDFCALQDLMQNFSPGSSPSINNNSYNPSTTDIANGNCSN
ncbi:fibronectin type III domain-containing protein [Winogradskyella helgolandensis]|uniref:fibronectin type III domain-containing protein n=1 Tax=Winogradskyella helgolandensis TaxID=2697010 RepID=UPI0015C933E5|nr:fibronectin type III domain-containing protein [Winogradskyella helgolandensis]